MRSDPSPAGPAVLALVFFLFGRRRRLRGGGLSRGGRAFSFRRGNRRRGGPRLTGFGRLALVAGLALAFALVWGAQAAFRSFRAGDSSTPPAVSAPPPRAELDVDRLTDLPRTRERFESARAHASEFDPHANPRLVEWLGADDAVPHAELAGWPSNALRVEYSLDETLTEDVFEVLRKGRVERGHAIVIDPRTGRLLAYVSTDPESFPAERAYPAASIVKVLSAAALLEEEARGADTSCVYRGNKYRLNRRRLDRPRTGRESGLEDALATSNNQCFSQWAVHTLGEERLRSTFERFGWLAPPAPGHEAGRIEMVETRLDLGRLGSGLDGLRVTPLHVAALTTILTDGSLREPWWVDRVVDPAGRSVALPDRAAPRSVLSPAQADDLREMLVATTTRGTAKGAFRTRRGRKLLGDVRVAGKTGNLTGRDPFGRYEWFVGLAPAEDPKIGVVVLQLQSNLWWKKSSELAANILREVFCDRKTCEAAHADRFTGDLGPVADPRRVSELGEPI
ncbi:MAG: penicillin-binding transpeptidase domain-containing protein, partial [Myxococcota bacterium]